MSRCPRSGTVNEYRKLLESISRNSVECDRTKLDNPFVQLSDIDGGFPRRYIHILVEIPAPAGESFSIQLKASS